MKVERSETFVEQSDIARNASIFTYLTSFLYVVCGQHLAIYLGKANPSTRKSIYDTLLSNSCKTRKHLLEMKQKVKFSPDSLCITI